MNTSLELVVPSSADAAVIAAFEAHHVDLLRFAMSLFRTEAEAEDAVQDAFMKLTASARSGELPDDVRAWLFTVCLNRARSSWRKRSVAERFLPFLDRGRPPTQPDEDLELRDTVADVQRIVRSLPVDQRTAFLLAVAGFSGPEIATMTGHTNGATRMLIWRARETIRHDLEAGVPR